MKHLRKPLETFSLQSKRDFWLNVNMKLYCRCMGSTLKNRFLVRIASVLLRFLHNNVVSLCLQKIHVCKLKSIKLWPIFYLYSNQIQFGFHEYCDLIIKSVKDGRWSVGGGGVWWKVRRICLMQTKKMRCVYVHTFIWQRKINGIGFKSFACFLLRTSTNYYTLWHLPRHKRFKMIFTITFFFLSCLVDLWYTSSIKCANIFITLQRRQQ